MMGLDRSRLPIFWGHGKNDPTVLCVPWTALLLDHPSYSFILTCSVHRHDDALRSVHELEHFGQSSVTFNSYPNVAHTHIPLELDQLADWMEDILPTDDVFSTIYKAQDHKTRGHRRRVKP